MKTEKKYLSPYHNDALMSAPRRTFASLVDALILFVVSFCLLLGSNAIVGAIPSYASQIETINASRVKMYQMQEETKLFDFPSKEDGSKDYSTPVDQNEVFRKYVLSNVLYSYSLYKDSYDKLQSNLESEFSLLKKTYPVDVANYENDRLAYFYVHYAPEHNINIPSPSDTVYGGYKLFLEGHSKGAEWEYFPGEEALPVLKPNYGYRLFRYTFYEDGGQDGLTAYNYLMSQYQGVFEEEGQILFKSEGYQAIYQEYLHCYENCSRVVSLFSFLSYVVSFLLALLLPTLLFKNGETVGLFLFKGAVLQKDQLEVSKGEVLLRGLISFFSFFPVMLFSCFFAGGLNSGWMYPLFSIGNLNISFFNLTVILFIVPILNALVCFIRKDKRNLADLAGGTIVIDKRFHADIVEEEKAKEEEKKEEASLAKIIPDAPYFDSTSFNNTERKNPKPNEEKKED